MHSSNAPDPYDMSNLFYHNFWNVVGDDVVEVVLSIPNSSHMLEKDKLDSYSPNS